MTDLASLSLRLLLGKLGPVMPTPQALGGQNETEQQLPSHKRDRDGVAPISGVVPTWGLHPFCPPKLGSVPVPWGQAGSVWCIWMIFTRVTYFLLI